MDDPEKWLHGVERAAYWLRKAAELGDNVAASGLGMYEQILKLHKQGMIKDGTPLDKCMDILSKAAKEEEKLQQEEQLRADRRAKVLCQHCGGELEKKLFGWKCKSCGKKKDY